MPWIRDLESAQPIAYGVLVLCAVAALGLAFGSLRIRGLSLGIAGVLFGGIFLGHLGLRIDEPVRAFLQEFGLILFVYAIGMQVGPGLWSALRRQGLALNSLAAGVVLLGAALTVGLCHGLGVDLAIGAGIFAGATTNTPALGAAQEALKGIPGLSPGAVATPGLGYAVAYPLGIFGVILVMLALKALLRVNLARELEQFQAAQRSGQESLERMSLVVENPNLDGLPLRSLPGLGALRVVVSRIRPAGATAVRYARSDTALGRGDVLLAVGPRADLEQLRLIVGRESAEDLLRAPGEVAYERVVLTQRALVGQTLRDVALDHRYGVTVTRLTRGDLELPIHPDLRLQFGDMLRLVGPKDDLAKAAQGLGNSVKELNHTKLVPLFVGIALGVLVGCYPIAVGRVPVPVRLGLAGGPLVVAILLSRVGRIGPLLWHLPINANILLREFGIVLFLACVGLKSGANFYASLAGGEGFLWMAIGAGVTVVPLVAAALVGRLALRLGFLDLCGLLSGSMTDPPALAFAQSVSGSEAPAVAYATVYPLTMLLRIVTAQLIVVLLCG